MKKLFVAAFAFVFAATGAMAQNNQSPKKTVESDNVSVTYGAPSKKGREIFGGLVPYDQVWRTGANNATEITLKKDGIIGGISVKAGTYSLFTIPKADGEWTLILNPTLGQWGAYGYDKIKDKDLPHISAKASKTSSVTEQMEIKLERGNMIIMWDDTAVTVPLTI